MGQKEKRIVFVCSNQLAEVVKNLMEKYGETESSIMRRAIIELNRKEFKDYVKNIPNPKMTLDEKVEFDLKRKELKKQKIEDRQRAICVKLNGKIKASGGSYICIYDIYSRHGKFEQSLPLDNLTEELIDMQFQPSKEKLREMVDNGIIKLELPN